MFVLITLHVCLLAVPRAEEQALSPLPAQLGKGDKGEFSDGTKDQSEDPNKGNWYPHGELVQFCKNNLVDRSLTVCCPLECGQCGGGGCANAPGGAKECCHEDIMHGRGENHCLNETQTSCVMPETCEQDQCLPFCPLHPGCSIIWSQRNVSGLGVGAKSMDYEAMRSEAEVLSKSGGGKMSVAKESPVPAKQSTVPTPAPQ